MARPMVIKRSFTTSVSPLRLVTFETKAKARKVGLQMQDSVADVTEFTGIKDMRTLMEQLETSGFRQKLVDFSNSGKHRINLKDVTLKAPISNPEKIMCIGLNYVDHAKETGAAIPTEPVLFNKFPTAIVGPNDNIVKPSDSNELDYEAELVVVIGKTGRNIPASKALSYIGGFTVGHDVSARDWQKKKPGGQWLSGKSFDTFAPIGPAIVTSVSDPHNLSVKCTLNGNVMQNGNTKDLIFKLDKLIEYISRIATLKPGDLLFTGTPAGVGAARKPPVFMKGGDTVTIEIQEIGTLTNYLVEESK